MRAYFVAGLVCLLVSGCVTDPSFETLSGVTPKTIVDVIECELIEARQKIRDANKNSKDKIKRPTLDEWTAVADLTLQVDEEASLAPAFTHTDVVSKSLTRVFDWGVKFDAQATRILYGDRDVQDRRFENMQEASHKGVAQRQPGSPGDHRHGLRSD